MNAFDFARHAVDACSRHPFIRGIEVLLIDEPVAKIKAVIDDSTHISIFHNAETVKFAYALIKADKRIFGVDNTKGWHVHPFEDPDSHQDIAEEISLLDFLDMVAKNRDLTPS